jgi:hypothetical protein
LHSNATEITYTTTTNITNDPVAGPVHFIDILPKSKCEGSITILAKNEEAYFTWNPLMNYEVFFIIYRGKIL